MDCNPCSSDFFAEYFRHTLDIRHSDSALVCVLIFGLPLRWIFRAVCNWKIPSLLGIAADGEGFLYVVKLFSVSFLIRANGLGSVF